MRTCAGDSARLADMRGSVRLTKACAPASTGGSASAIARAPARTARRPNSLRSSHANATKSVASAYNMIGPHHVIVLVLQDVAVDHVAELLPPPNRWTNMTARSHAP